MLTVTLQQEFSFTCPSAWTDGAVENLQCVIPQAKFSAKPGGLCDIYSDSVVFQLTKADGTKTTVCTVIGFDTACDGSVNADGCGCREISGGNIVIDYNITAVKADHEGARWECEPQCYDANGIPSVLSPPNTTECLNTIFGKWKVGELHDFISAGIKFQMDAPEKEQLVSKRSVLDLGKNYSSRRGTTIWTGSKTNM